VRVSVVVTVLNEVGSLPGLLDSLAGQSRPPDEVVICDGGSKDGTLQLLAAESRLPLHVLSEPGANISQGRNQAIAAATGEVIAVTDAGVRLSPVWLEKIVAPFEGGAQAVAGSFVAAPRTVFETAMGATVLPRVEEIDLERYPPSSRSFAFRKSAWSEVGGYPEWLDYCEDLVFDFQLRERYGPFVFEPEALVHFRPRSGLRAFVVQYYRYARGDGRAALWLERHAVRYLAYLVIAPAIAVAGALGGPWWLLLYLVAVPAMFWTGWWRLVRVWDDLGLIERLLAALWVPVIRVVGDAAKMVGVPVGVWWRLRHRPPDWRGCQAVAQE
jgi:glycosyltransferase involved in cell wall biosynthesis